MRLKHWLIAVVLILLWTIAPDAEPAPGAPLAPSPGLQYGSGGE